MTIALGKVGHFSLAVADPQASARWWGRLFDLEPLFEGDDVVGLTNDNVTIVFFKGAAHPETIEHMSFHLPDMKALHAALEWLQKYAVVIEDPGDEIGPEAEGSSNMGLWFHDPDGYRWELSVLGKEKA